MIRNKGFSPVKKREKTSEASYKTCRSSNEAANRAISLSWRRCTHHIFVEVMLLKFCLQPLTHAKRKLLIRIRLEECTTCPDLVWEWWGNLMVGDERSGRRFGHTTPARATFRNIAQEILTFINDICRAVPRRIHSIWPSRGRAKHLQLLQLWLLEMSIGPMLGRFGRSICRLQVICFCYWAKSRILRWSKFIALSTF